MKVLLVDLDLLQQNRRRKFVFPNLALLKLSAYHKGRGDEVYLNFPLDQPDITYASCVFTWNAKRRAAVPDGANVGGSGVDLRAELPPEVEHIMPDYSLYPGVDYSSGFTSRGCPRRCPWCIVPEKEGVIRAAARIYEFWNRQHRKIMLLDNNLLAAPNWRLTINDLIAEDIEVDFRQGLDIRLVNEDNAGYLKRVKTKLLRFAFDDIGYESALRRGIELLLDAGIASRHLSFYVLYGFQNDDMVVERVKILQSYNVEIYPMEYIGPDGKKVARRLLEVSDLPLLHGSRANIKRFLRKVGRLPE